MLRKKISKRQYHYHKRRPGMKHIWFYSLFIGIPLGIFLTQLLFSHPPTSAKPIGEDESHLMKKLPSKVAIKYKQATPSAELNLQVPILMYHYVEFVRDPKDTIRKSLDIIPPVLDKQIKT